jgi:ABC-type polysaccharide/polyol phosphate transport system ATPase subunit
LTRPAILVDGVGVRFRPYVDKKPTLRRSLANMRTRQVQEVIALDDVTFRVEKGEAFGIIGANGAGKSTLLRVMAKTLQPNSGRVVVNGRASTLLQLGVGMNPELSGSRNIYLGGLAAGLRRSDVDAIVDDVVEYAGLDDAIDRPVKTYSSGMFSRLAFSVSIHLEPDILLLDEVLAVGDAEFRDKSMASMRELLDRAGTIVFVSHSLGQVVDFCDRAMWLERGRVKMIGDAEKVVNSYRGDRKNSAKTATGGKGGA